LETGDQCCQFLDRNIEQLVIIFSPALWKFQVIISMCFDVLHSVYPVNIKCYECMLEFSFSLIVTHASPMNNRLITAEEYDNVKTTSLQYDVRPKLIASVWHSII